MKKQGLTRRAPRIVLAGLVMCTAAPSLSCSSTNGRTVQTRISPNAKPLDNAKAMRATVKPTQLIFPVEGDSDVAALTPGSVLTSGYQDGFLRRVTSVETTGSNIVVNTSDATLLDLVEEGESSTTLDFATDGPEGWRSWSGLRPMTGGQKGFEITLDGKEIWSDPARGLSVRITKGSVQFVPRLDVAITVQDGMTFRAVASGDLATDLHVEATCRQQFAKSSFKVELWSSPAFRVPLPPIGVVPVVADARLFIEAGVEISAGGEIKVTTGATAKVNASYGVTYDGAAGWQKVKSLDTQWTGDPPLLSAQADLHSLAYVSAGVDLGLFGGLKVPFVDLGVGARGRIAFTADPYLQFDTSAASTSSWALLAGLRGRYWGSLSVLGATVASVTSPVTLFDTSEQIAPTGGGDAAAPVSGALAACPDAVEPDCGGARCSPCAEGKGCVAATDCASGSCVNGACARQVPSSCTNGVQDGDETGVDCGGGCLECNGASCANPTDCRSGACKPAAASGASSVCAPPSTCSDGIKDDGETDVDCGGPCAPEEKCADGQACSKGTDCAGGSCGVSAKGVCDSVPSNCTDGVEDGDETGVDCGGSCPATCGGGDAGGGGLPESDAGDASETD